MTNDLFDYERFENPFRPGAGHKPPFLAGRFKEQKEFDSLLNQSIILENLILMGLRGVGKTVLLESFKPLARTKKWLWVGTDLTEASSISEQNMATIIITDLSMKTSDIVIGAMKTNVIGFESTQPSTPLKLNYETLLNLYHTTPGLVSDKLKHVLEVTWECLPKEDLSGVIFAYDEAQNLADHATHQEYPLSLLLDVFQSLQRKEIPFMLVLTGLPMLYAKLVQARTFSERMFHLLELSKLTHKDCKDAIRIPIENQNCPVKFDEGSIELIATTSGGYPYFIQFICREVYDVFIQKIDAGVAPSVPINGIIAKLDSDFFSGRWQRATERQRHLLSVIANLDNCDREFTALEISQASKLRSEKSFSASHTTQMLSDLCNIGLVYRNRHGKYSLAVPLLHEFIKRQEIEDKS